MTLLRYITAAITRHMVLLFALISPVTALCQNGAPTDITVLGERRDANGELIRTIQYYQNGKRVVETRIIRPVAQLDIAISPDTLNQEHMMLVINKTRFALDLYYKRKRIRSYKVVFGPRPKDNKMMKGDRKTPEGWFRIQDKHLSAKYNKFLHLDYPNDSSRARFNILKAKGQIPPNADIGGDVGIHGVWQGGDNMIEMGIGWTDGCIAMKNKDMDDLYRLVDVGARVLIRH